MTAGATEQIASFVKSYRLDTGDKPLVSAARALVSDYVAVTVAGLSGPLAHPGRFLEPGGAGSSTVVGSDARHSARDAAMANGMLAHSLEFDDSTLRPIGHPGCTILPTLFALGEREAATGRDLLEAYVVGLEVHARLGQLEAGNWDAGGQWLPIGSIGQVGAAAAAARLLDLQQGQIENCLALAAHLAGQLSISIGTAAKAVGAGSAAWTAVQAADLARAGVDGPRRVIERARGLAEVFLGSGGGERTLGPLGRPHHLLEHGVAIKKYPAVYACQWPNDGLRQLMEQHGLRAGDMSRIQLLRPEAGAFCDCPRPRSVEEARSSFEYNLAAIALTGNAGLASFTEERLHDPAQIAMQRRIAVSGHPPGTELSHTWRYLVHVHTRDHRSIENRVRYPSGHPRNPLSAAEARAKWAECTEGHLGHDASTELHRLIHDLEGQPSLRDITGLLRTAR